MKSRPAARTLALIIGLAVPAGTAHQPAAAASRAAAPKAAAPKADRAAEFFDMTRVWPIHLTVSVENWKAMQPPPASPTGPTIPIGAIPPPTGPHPRRGGIAGRVGLEFPEVRATMELDGKTYRDIGLRFKGNATYLSTANTLKRPLKIDLNRFVPKQECFGLATLNLNNNVTDPSQMRETLAYLLHRDAGLPAPRTTYARVTLTVPGIYERKYIGLYTVIEQVDSRFLKHRLGSGAGLLLKPDQIGPLPYLGEEWLAYDAAYWPKSKPTEAARQRLIAFTRLIHKSDERAFREQIRSFVDVDLLLRFVAVNALIANLDSFLAIGQNYYLYLHPAKNQFYWIPWDLDLAFGSWFLGGSAEQQADLSIMHPYTGEHPLLERLLAMPEVRAAYRQHVRKLLATSFRPDRLERVIVAVGAAIRPAIADELPEQLEKFTTYLAASAPDSRPAASAPSEPPRGGFGPPPPMPLKRFLALRAASVKRQLKGESNGYIPEAPMFGGPRGGGGRGPGGPGGGRGGPGGFAEGPGVFLAPPIMQAIDRDGDEKLTPEEFRESVARWAVAWDTDQSGVLSLEELREGLNSLFGPPRGPGGPGRGGRGGGGFGGQSAGLPPLAPNDPAREIRGPGRDGGPFGGGPGGFLGPAILRVADADRDGKVTPEEFQAAAARWAVAWDTDQSGTVELAELRAGINQLLAPPGVGAPPGPPPAGEPRDVTASERKEGRE